LRCQIGTSKRRPPLPLSKQKCSPCEAASLFLWFKKLLGQAPAWMARTEEAITERKGEGKKKG
jgi:hypothetical protein